MTRPKKGEVKLIGINRDGVPGDVPEDWWTDGRNVMFVAGETCRVPGEGLFAAPSIKQAQFVHYVDTGVQNWWIYGGDNGVAVTDGVVHYNITPAGWARINFVRELPDGRRFVNDSRGLLYLIDRNGRVAYKSKPGPFGFKPDELKAAIQKSAIVQ